MHHIVPRPEFAALTEEQVESALDAFEAHPEIRQPIALEVQRLIEAYSAYLDQQCRQGKEIGEEILLYEPATPIEQAAYDIFSEALHDSLLEAAEEDEEAGDL